MYYFIINPASQSGRGYKIWKKIEQRLVRDGVEYQAFDRICGAGDRVCKEADVPLQGGTGDCGRGR